ncbi:hypothetical protein FF011L_45210 [Roseimaritima multifibrata]|uniref:Uncharacterized protein n=1 Tax=Roseimaritima multifibrata TaxID=1930274 RepID=A0A517MLG0_9BACT|nr:hypothetical protein FF011L_45210 [Roseimaritima multifibrata]
MGSVKAGADKDRPFLSRLRLCGNATENPTRCVSFDAAFFRVDYFASAAFVPVRGNKWQLPHASLRFILLRQPFDRPIR